MPQQTFYYFNLHMDHVGVVARREAAKLVPDNSSLSVSLFSSLLEAPNLPLLCQH